MQEKPDPDLIAALKASLDLRGPSVPPQRVEPEPELLDALKASLGQRYAGMKDAPWFKEAHEGKPLGEGARVDSVEPPASPELPDAWEPSYPDSMPDHSQEGPSEYEEMTKEPESMSVGKLNAVVRALRERLYQQAIAHQSALSSSRVAVRDEALTGVGRFMFHLHDETRHDPQMGNKELCCRCFPEYKPDCHCGMETACRALKGGKP